jgi:hypothetical protein
MAILKGLVVVLILTALGLFAAGVKQFRDETTGAKVVATVTECHHVSGLHGGSTACSGSWIVGGNLLGRGHVVLGTINGVGYGNVGKTVTARVHGDSAYTTSHKTAIALFSVGVGLLVVAGWFGWAIATGRADGSRARAAAAAKAATRPAET